MGPASSGSDSASSETASDLPREVRREVLTGPSFYAHLEALKRHRRWLGKLGAPDREIARASSKEGGRELSARAGVAVPPLLGRHDDLASLLLPEGERGVVIKPVKGSGGKGVVVLEREGEGFWSVLEERPTTWDRVRRRLGELEEAGRIRGPYLVEAALPGPEPRQGPYDWKLYCIGGEPLLTLQKQHHVVDSVKQPRFKFWTPDWQDAGAVMYAQQLAPDLPAPHHPEELLDAARRIAREVPGPFARIDLYDTPAGVWFGEITPHPGGPPLFDPATDRRLGKAWERAVAAAEVASAR